MDSTIITPQQVLDVAMEPGRNDVGATSVRGYLTALLAELWREEEGFSGKRPFGNSGWQHDVYSALAKAGYVRHSVDEDGCVEYDRAAEAKGQELMLAAIAALGEPPVVQMTHSAPTQSSVSHLATGAGVEVFECTELD
jgi:hypothetical protein